ncbi:hypothetical protein NL676_032812 [Syzygium grande]|nr:hypothetical protein NL676_032812 [Syzygium grande]
MIRGRLISQTQTRIIIGVIASKHFDDVIGTKTRTLAVQQDDPSAMLRKPMVSPPKKGLPLLILPNASSSKDRPSMTWSIAAFFTSYPCALTMPLMDGNHFSSM